MGGEMTEFSVLLPLVPHRPEQVLQYAALVEWTNAHRLWQGQTMLVEPFQGFASAAGAGFRVPVGIGVTLMPLRHPHEAAHQARSLAMVTGQSVVAGFGPGGVSFQRSLLGAPYRSPLTAARDYLGIVRGLLAGQEVHVAGEYFTCHAAMGSAFFPPVELGLGVLRPGMARLAGEVADVAITWLTPAAYLQNAIQPALREGAARAGRAAPRLTAMVPVALSRPGGDPAEVVLASNYPHMQAPHYNDMLRRADIELTGSDPALDAQRMIEGGAFIHGDVEQVLAHFAAYQDAGVDEIVLNLTGTFNLYGGQATKSDLNTILAAVRR
jgi:alkanesulfonate monooxygenase SsuD/methylene tetrahydromethanopterin reductase-like flavin-dependent oxidoreductase (luciferase family)